MNIKIGNGTNFYAGFKLAFELLTASASNGFDSKCNKAMLFITDGGMTQPIDGLGSLESDVHNLINE